MEDFGMKHFWEGEIKQADQLPEFIQPLADRIGVTATLEVMDEFEGLEIYFPKKESHFQGVWQTLLRAEWRTGKGKGERDLAARLAKKFNITERRVRQIAGDHENQIDLFGKME